MSETFIPVKKLLTTAGGCTSSEGDASSAPTWPFAPMHSFSFHMALSRSKKEMYVRGS